MDFIISVVPHRRDFVVDKDDVFLGTSADGTVSCKCCGKGSIEIQCSHKHQDASVSFAASSDPLFRLNEMLKQEKAPYYNQVQFEMMTHDVEYCDIFVSVAVLVYGPRAEE